MVRTTAVKITTGWTLERQASKRGLWNRRVGTGKCREREEKEVEIFRHSKLVYLESVYYACVKLL